MPSRISSNNQPPGSSAARSSRKNSGAGQAAPPEGVATPDPLEQQAASSEPDAIEQQEERDIASELNFRDAQTALELSLAALQAPDLDVEEMAGLYRRASTYADRCEQLLQEVEQEVMQWDPGQPQEPPQPYQA